MVEARRQGRLSFYMGSTGEESMPVGAAAALGPDDVITCQYRGDRSLLTARVHIKRFYEPTHV